MEDYNKNKESSYFQYWDVNNLYGWAMLQKVPVNNFKWVKDINKLDESFRKSYNEQSHKGYFLELDIQYPKKLNELHNDLQFLPERMMIEKLEKLISN